MSKILYHNPKLLAPISDPKHLVTKEYLDLQISKKIKEPVRVVATQDLGAAYVSADQTLTQNHGSVLKIDGVTVDVGDRVLVVGQPDATQNGIYTVTTLGTDETSEGLDNGTPAVLTRAEDFDASAKIYPNVIIPVSEGASQGDITWQLVNDAQPTLDSTSLTFAAYTDPAATAVYSEEFEVQTDKTEWTITHGMNSKKVIVQVYNEDDEEVMFNIKKASENTIKVIADETPEVGSKFTVVVIG